MSSSAEFLDEFDDRIARRMAQLEQMKAPDLEFGGAASRSEVVRRLKMALRSELEASELAALWIATTPEIEVKLGLARQAGDEARHYRMIEEHLAGLGADLSGFDPLQGGYSPMFQLLSGLSTTVERVAAAQYTRESLALTKNRQFIEFCEAAGARETAALYRDSIQPDEEWHVRFGRRALGRYAVTPALREKALRASEAVLDLAVRMQDRQVSELKASHAPGC